MEKPSRLTRFYFFTASFLSLSLIGHLTKRSSETWDPSITSSTLTSSALSAAAAATSSLSPHPPTTASSSISPMLTPCSWSSLVFTHGLELVDSL
ncbi:hypothetical protein V6N11_042080 [Hibiscus sabdariffa]|uniref:Uncharacterized protein n=1 Tax=Hibiscus sabdariffa TaxID=183260 RepID=A0ABR2QVC6_9ROSI